MKRFVAKVVVKLKPDIVDAKGQMLKRAIESYVDIKNLVCHIGTSYSLQFDAENQIEALNLVEKIAKELLTNEITEFFEVRSFNEID